MKEGQLMQADSLVPTGALQAFSKETLVNGRPSTIRCVEIEGQTYVINKGLVSVAQLEDEWFDDVANPDSVIRSLRDGNGVRPDLFTFWQRVPAVEPQYNFYLEWESLAVLPVSTCDNWFNKQIKGTTRNMIRKSQKAGIQVRDCTFDDDFVRGMTEIFNEAPVRQGRAFCHYGKDFQTVKRQFARFLFREDLVGAYHGNEMVGFVMLGNGGKFALLGQFLSKLSHRDKAVNNALIAHSVQICERRKIPYLVYGYWGASSLGDFKHNSGFIEMKVPRYFVPLTAKGRLALRLHLHTGWKSILPGKAVTFLKKVRKFVVETRASRR